MWLFYTPAVTFTVTGPGGFSKEVRSPPNRPLLKTLQAVGVDLIVAACNGKGQCSTCHIILPPTVYAALPAPSLDECDMLDVAADATDFSRLACQCKVHPALEGATIEIPEHVINYMDLETGAEIGRAHV